MKHVIINISNLIDVDFDVEADVTREEEKERGIVSSVDYDFKSVTFNILCCYDLDGNEVDETELHKTICRDYIKNGTDNLFNDLIEEYLDQ